jgi:hypothetical protein
MFTLKGRMDSFVGVLVVIAVLLEIGWLAWPHFRAGQNLRSMRREHPLAVVMARLSLIMLVFLARFDAARYQC